MLDDVDALSPMESDDAGEANTQAAEIAEHIRRLWTEQVSFILLGSDSSLRLSYHAAAHQSVYLTLFVHIVMRQTAFAARVEGAWAHGLTDSGARLADMTPELRVRPR